MDLDLSGKIALVTGASRGIGRAIAESLWREGCTIALNARDPMALQSQADRFGARVSFHAGDVTVPASAVALVDAVRQRWGRLDIVICNVGSGVSVPPGAETPAEWQRVMDLNLYATTNIVAAAAPGLEAGGAIVCLSSICGREVLGAPLTYSAAKAALDIYVRGMARPLARRGIRINAVSPGNVAIPGGRWEARRAEDPEGVDAMLAREVPLARFGSPEEIADIVTFLASPRAAFVTGAIWVADGGQTRS